MISIEIDTSAVQGVLRRVGDIARAPWDQGRGRLAAVRARRVIRREFTQQGGFNAAGSFNRWKKTRPFGVRKPPAQTLGGPDGGLAQSWLGGPGSIQTFGRKRFVLGSRHPAAEVHRGGREFPSRRVTRIPVTAKMRARLRAADIQVFLKKNTKFIKIEGRPHIDSQAPQYAEAAGSVVLEAIAEADR